MILSDFSIHTDVISLSLRPGNRAHFYLRTQPGNVEIIYPPNTLFEQIQPWLSNVIKEALRKQARLYLPPRLEQLAKEHGFSYERVCINSARTRWGSCSGKRHINLSLYLMILPSHLIDYVLLHELCHTREMNHGPKFWTLMNQVTCGKALELRKEVRNYPSPFVATSTDEGGR